MLIADGCQRPRQYKFEFSFVGNDRRPPQKSGTRRENRNAHDSPDLSPFFPDDRGYLRFRVFINPGFHMSGQIWRFGSVSIFPTRPRFLRWSATISDK